MKEPSLSTVLPLAKASPAKPKKIASERSSSKAKKSVKPRAKPAVLKQREEMADRAAKSLGFASREEQPVILKKRRLTHHDEPVDQLSIRGPVRVLNKFITYCETENLSYWEALDRVLD